MEVLHVAAECYPAAKVGGLGDVVGALPKYLNKMGHVAKVVMPNYKNKFSSENSWEVMHVGDFAMSGSIFHFRIIKEKTDKLGFELYQVEIPGLLEQEFPYGYVNDTERHVGFQIAVLDWLNTLEHQPDVVHCHDHHTGLIPFLLKYGTRYKKLNDTPTVFTIHNGNYQGIFGWDKRMLLPDYDADRSGMLEWNYDINSMAAAIKSCWRFTTVSPGYLDELSHAAAGLESLFVSERQKGAGILNGIDAEVWNPADDKMISKNYTAETVTEGKAKNKKALCENFHLDASKPLFAFIGRLVHDKGADLLSDSIKRSIVEQNRKQNFMVLGSGADEYELALNSLKNIIPENFNCYIGYHEKLAHLIYAGADFLLMPSRTEPCGLNQLYALRYGTVPMVRSVGGLKDTVIDFGDENGFGIRFDQASVNDISYSVKRAMKLFNDKELLTSIQKRMMKIDHSWDVAAKEYVQLYESLK